MKLLSGFYNTMKTPNSVYRYFVGLALAVAFILLLPLLAMK